VTTGTVEILIVEDNPNDLDLAIHALKRHNFANRIQVARNGQEALDCLRASDPNATGAQPRVVLLDLKLPKVDGLLRNQPPTSIPAPR
jgi:two-component system, response regulator